eukprot:UN21582
MFSAIIINEMYLMVLTLVIDELNNKIKVTFFKS